MINTPGTARRERAFVGETPKARYVYFLKTDDTDLTDCCDVPAALAAGLIFF